MKEPATDRAPLHTRAGFGDSDVNVSSEGTCAHCGMELGKSYVVEDGRSYCCNGCATAFVALAESGLDDGFYDLQVLASKPKQTSASSSDALQREELDSAPFLEEHTRPDHAGRSVDLFVDGMHCAACVWLIERLPFEMEGVSVARVDLPRARLSLTFDPDRAKLSGVVEWLAKFGYTARPMRKEGAGRPTDAERKLLLRMGVAWALAGNVMLIAFALYSGLESEGSGLALAARWISLALAIPAVFYGGAPFLRRAWASVRTAVRSKDVRRLHMDTPIALGILVGFLHSAWATIAGRGEVWFDSITVLIAALLTARWLQLRSRRLAGEASDRLLALVPSMVRRVRQDGKVEVVRVDDVRPGEIVEIPGGEVIPVDGVVDWGESRLNNAVITGESRPENVAPGDRVVAGATNISSPIRVRVEAAGDDTRVGKLLAWVRDAENRKAPVVLLADRIGGYFVLGVLGLAAVTAVLWWSLDSRVVAQHVVALLVITCPCALGMATPLAMAIAAGRAARRGLFIKTDEATQQLTTVDTVVLDKTGTITEGKMQLVGWTGSPDALKRVAALERHSNHPLAEAIVQADESEFHADVCEVEVVPGAGIEGVVDGGKLFVGRPDWVEQRAGVVAADLVGEIEKAVAKGYTPVLAATSKQLLGLATVGDGVRDDALPLIHALQREGRSVHILSGDHPETVATVAGWLGIQSENARGGISPEEKRHIVEGLREHGHSVMMVGDGVNDAVALQSADVGVAVGGGSTASLVAADVFMTRPGVEPLFELLSGSSAVMRTIRAALGISLVYNLVGATAAMTGLVTPLVAAVAMPVSSLLVVAMAILQPSFKKEQSRGSLT